MKGVKEKIGRKGRGGKRGENLWFTKTVYPPAGRSFNFKNFDGLPAL
jgi:hypothetical protein